MHLVRSRYGPKKMFSSFEINLKLSKQLYAAAALTAAHLIVAYPTATC